jgi:uncharacterized protein (DUF1778 family)
LPNWHLYGSLFSRREVSIIGTAKAKKREPADIRITARVSQSTRSLIDRAAALYGASINQFIVQAAVARANEVLRCMETVRLSSRDARFFMDALAKPPQPNNKLIDAVSAHNRLVESGD